jgi:hypothetical protein
MPTKVNVTESRMLEDVRRWRREAYEADQARNDEERKARLHELAQQFKLRIAPGDRAAQKQSSGEV